MVIDDLGRISVEDKFVITDEELSSKVKNFLVENPQGKISLYASREADYNNVVSVLDVLKKVAGNRVSLSTKEE